jgi:hypothetical protein
MAKIKIPSLSAKAPKGPPPLPPVTSVKEFYLDDFERTLFPLKSNRELVIHGESEIKSYIEKCLSANDVGFAFLPQKRVYGAKPRRHLRRTMKLDVVSEYYLYDLIFRNRAKFRKPHSVDRAHYGYRFDGGNPEAASSAYKSFKGAIAQYRKEYSHYVSFDVASYFNSVYHHDLANWFAALGVTNEDAQGFGQLLRQINSGRSVDCLPQGLYPSKMIGNDFLRFVDNHSGISSDKLIRFMDDVYAFANSAATVQGDFEFIQRLLGEKGLSVNPQKTLFSRDEGQDIDKSIDEIKAKLLKRRRMMVTIGYDENDEAVVGEHLFKMPLSDKELEYIGAILANPKIDEEDAELILTIMRDHARKVEGRLPYLIETFPNLAKNVYLFCSHVDNKELIASAIYQVATSGERLLEYQLFWFAAILEDHLMMTSKASALISTLYNHQSATAISKAKILEIADVRFGLPELRDEHLASGQSDWLAWASAVGSRSLAAAARNYKLGYFANGSQMNHLISTIVGKMP